MLIYNTNSAINRMFNWMQSMSSGGTFDYSAITSNQDEAYEVLTQIKNFIEAMQATLPLPSGASTSLEQIKSNDFLESIDSKTSYFFATGGTVTGITATTALSNGTQQLVAASSNRRAVTILNKTNRALFIAIGTTSNNTHYTVELGTNDYYEVPNRMSQLSINFTITQATATGTVLVTTAQ